MKTLFFQIHGKVQGVSFRYYTRKEAHKLSIRGTVKNLFNGDVEVYAQGDNQALNRFEKFLKTGSSLAHIKSIKKKEIESNKVFRSFEIIY
jgi:acylphosphatase